MNFKDHFSAHAGSYAESRPGYPATLFSYLAGLCQAHETAWDCATGNGQAAIGLAAHFQQVLATDASPEQIQQARPSKRVRYRVMNAESPDIEDASLDLLTVAQALHWFDIERFFKAAERVLKPGGILAAWCYGLHRVSPRCDAVIARLYHEVLGNFWPPERCHVEQGYKNLRFPFKTIAAPAFAMTCRWSMQEVLDYYGSWSATQRYMAQEGASPLELIRDEFTRAWGDGRREVRWPLSLHVSRK